MKFPHLHIPSKIRSSGIQKLSRALTQYRTRSAWGLDIGDRALKAVRITQISGRLLVEDMDIVEYPALPSDGNFLQSPVIKEAVQAFLAKRHIAGTDNVILSIPGQFVLSRFTAIPRVNKKQLKNIVSYEAKQQIPFDLKDIVWDYQQLAEQVPGTESMEIGMFASKRTTLDQLLANISPLHTGLTAIQASPLAIFNFISFDRQTDGLTIIINLETENADIIIADDQYFWLRSIPISKVDTDLIKEIQRSMEYYKSLMKEPVHFKTLLLMGNRFKDPINVKYITDNFAYEVKVLKTLNNLELSATVSPVYFSENVTYLGVALGLALQGIGFGKIKINLLPQELIKAAEMSKKKPYVIATLGCFAASLIIQYCGFHVLISHLHGSCERHQKVLQDIKELERKYKNAETIAQTKKSELDMISSIDSYRFVWMEVLDKLLSLIPDNVSITSIRSSWIDADAVKTDGAEKQTTPDTSQMKKPATSAKPGTSRRLLLMGIKGESKEPGMRFIEECILKPIQNMTIFDYKVPAFKNAEIVRGSSRQIDRKEGGDSYITFEVRWIVKSEDEVRLEENSLSLINGTSTSVKKS
ncbi:MAG: pilus assembly protein PilM [Candidatus Brocadia sp.]|jgi:Tfp pilus assembly PilM family ATPase